MSRDEDRPPVSVEWLELGPPEVEHAPVGSPRRPPRWVLLAAAAVLAVVVGVSLTHHHVSPAASHRPALPSGVPSASTSASASPPPAIPSAPPPALPAAPVRVTEVGHRLLGARGGWELFGRGFSVVVRVQPALGRVTTTVLPALNSGGPVTFLAGRSAAVVRPVDSVAGYGVPDGHPATPLSGALGHGGQVVPGPDPDHVWVPETADATGRMRLVRLDGRVTATSLTVPLVAAQTGQVVPDGAGYVAFTDTGGVYDSRPGGVRLITGGVLLAAGPSGWVTAECDDQNRCTTVVVDRATGWRRDLHVVPERAFQPGLVSPDGTVAALYTLTPTPGVRLLDLASGTSHRLAVSMPESGFAGGVLAWSPDSRWLFLAGTNDGMLYAVNPHSGALTVVDPALPPLSQVAVRTGP